MDFLSQLEQPVFAALVSPAGRKLVTETSQTLATKTRFSRYDKMSSLARAIFKHRVTKQTVG